MKGSLIEDSHTEDDDFLELQMRADISHAYHEFTNLFQEFAEAVKSLKRILGAQSVQESNLPLSEFFGDLEDQEEQENQNDEEQKDEDQKDEKEEDNLKNLVKYDDDVEYLDDLNDPDDEDEEEDEEEEEGSDEEEHDKKEDN